MKVLLVNQEQTNNVGDQAIGYVLSKWGIKNNVELKNYLFWKTDFVIPSTINKYIKKIIWSIPFLIDSFNIKHIKRIIEIEKPDGVIIGGGELFSRHRGFNSSFVCWEKMLNKRKIPFCVCGVGGGENLDIIMKYRIVKSAKKINLLYVRDKKTLKWLKKYNDRVKYAPDIVYSFYKLIKNDKKDKSIKNNIVCIPIEYCQSIKKYMKINSRDEYIEYLIKIINQNKDIDKIYFTSTVLDDYKIVSDLKDKYDKQNRQNVKTEIIKIKNIDEYLELLKDVEYVIAARMHALILASIYGKSIKAIKFNKKLINYDKEIISSLDNDKTNIKKISEKSYEGIKECYTYIINKKHFTK